MDELRRLLDSVACSWPGARQGWISPAAPEVKPAGPAAKAPAPSQAVAKARHAAAKTGHLRQAAEPRKIKQSAIENPAAETTVRVDLPARLDGHS